MSRLIEYFTPTLDQIAGLGAAILVAFALIVLGAAISRRKSLPEMNLVLGWAVIGFAYPVFAGLMDIPFRTVAIGLAICAVVGAFVIRRSYKDWLTADVGRAFLLSLPAIWLAACMLISQWDEFTNWVPNSRYIVMHDFFPGQGKPPATSVFPAYPHGLAYFTFMTSRIAGHLTENITGVFNLFLLAAFAVSVGRSIRSAITAPSSAASVPMSLKAVPAKRIGWLYCALGGLALTGFNPTFVPKIVFTAYADTATAVLVGMLTYIAWRLVDILSGNEDEVEPASLAWSFGLIAAALITVKQVNLVLFLLVFAGAAAVILRDPKISIAQSFRFFPAMLIPPISIYFLWRLHLDVNGIQGEFGILPREKWLTDHLITIAHQMLIVASKKGGYFFVMLVACGLAIRALIRINHPLDRLALVVATLFVGYTGFLYFAYVAAFGGEGLRAASFWRYNMHIGGACVLFGAYGLALLWRRWVTPWPSRDLTWLIIALLLISPIALAYKIRFDLHPPKVHIRAVMAETVKTLPRGSRFAIFDPTGNGQFAVMARYLVNTHVNLVGEVIVTQRPTPPNLRKYLSDWRPEYIWVHVATPAVREVLRLDLVSGHSHLIQQTDTSWKLIKSWPYPGYEDPNIVDD